MVNYPEERLDPIFSALADPTRRAILDRLSHGEATIGEVARPFPASLPAISKHIKILETAGLVERRKDGRTHHLRLVSARLEEAMAWLDQVRWYWETQFDSLEQFLQEGENDGTGRAR